MGLFKKREQISTVYDPKYYIENVVEKEEIKLNKWLSENTPKFNKGDVVNVVANYGSDYWGGIADIRPHGAYKVIGVLKIRMGYDISKTPDCYEYKYIIQEDECEFLEKADECDMKLI